MDFAQLEQEMKELDRQVAEWKVLPRVIAYFYESFLQNFTQNCLWFL